MLVAAISEDGVSILCDGEHGYRLGETPSRNKNHPIKRIKVFAEKDK